MTTATLGPSPGRTADPAHEIRVQAAAGRWSAHLDGELVARSHEALLLTEAGYDPVVYFPPGDVVTQRLAPSPTRTRCPFKGEAHYYTAAGGATDVAWFYPEDYDDVAAIAAHVAFFPRLVDIRQDRG